MNGLQTRPAEFSDIEAIARVHEVAFAGYFLTRMGISFLRTYYRLVLEYSGGILLVSGRTPEVDGFVAGFVNPAEFYVHMAHERRRLIGPALKAILRHPMLLPRVLYNRRRVESACVAREQGLCELSSIGVLPRSAGRGHGRILIELFCAEARSRGSDRIVLTTDSKDNEAVNAFYQRCGFTLEGSLASGGKRRMNEYVRRLRADGEPLGDQPG